MSTIAEAPQTAGQTTVNIDAVAPYPNVTTAQWNELGRIEARYGRVEPILRPNGVLVVYVLGTRPDRTYCGGVWPHIAVGLGQDGRPVWAMRPAMPPPPVTEEV